MSRPAASIPHLAWAGGHVLSVLCALRYLVGVVTFNASNLTVWYYLAFFGAVVSYGVVVYKSFGVPQLSKAYVQRAAMDENVQYLILAIYWSFSKPMFVTLIPYATFSLFHVLTFIRTTLIPMVFPNSAPATGAPRDAAPQSLPAKVGKVIQGWVKTNYDPAMRFVAYTEVAIFARVLLGAIAFRNSLLAPLLYAHFLRLRFYMSTFTRSAFQHVGGKLDQLTLDSRTPPVVRKAYIVVTDLASRYASSVLAVQNQPAASPTPNASTSGAATGASPQAGTSAANPRR